MTRIKLLAATIALAAVTIPQPTVAQGPSPTFDPRMYARCAGDDRPASRQPHQGRGRHSRQPHMFFMGVVNGGVWKTTDAGRTWQPDLRRPADRLDRRHRHCPVESRT